MKYNCASLVLGTEKMTALFRAIVIAIMMTMCSCTDAVYDDSDVRSGIADLNDRVSKLETLCAQMNSNIGALKEIVDALQGKEYIENVTPLSDNQGYIFTFSSGKSVIVYNGTDGKDGVTPRFKIKDGMWYVSYDDCVSWELLGKATGDDGADAGIVSVTEDDDCVHFEISDGTVITIAKRMPLALSFDSEDVTITTGGASKTVGYTLTGVSENVVVKALAQDGWKAVVTRTSATSGSIGITAPEPIIESEVIVLVCDGSNMTMGAINCMKSTILIAKENYQTDFHGGNIEIPVKANTAYSVSLPAGAASWITNVSTKSFTESTLNLCVSENETACVRRAVISLIDDYSGAVIKTFSVTQSGDPDKAADSIELIVENPGQLSLLLEPYQKYEIKKMKLYGNLNDADCDVICKEMTALEELDLSELAETEIAEGRFGGYWWLPLPILQNTTLVAVNQPLANFCLVIQNQRGTKTGQNHGKIKSRTLCPKYPLWNTSVSFAKVQICPLKNEGKSLFLSFTTHFPTIVPQMWLLQAILTSNSMACENWVLNFVLHSVGHFQK